MKTKTKLISVSTQHFISMCPISVITGERSWNRGPLSSPVNKQTKPIHLALNKVQLEQKTGVRRLDEAWQAVCVHAVWSPSLCLVSVPGWPSRSQTAEMDLLHSWGVNLAVSLQTEYRDSENLFQWVSSVADLHTTFFVFFPIWFHLRRDVGVKLIWVAVVGDWLNLVLKWWEVHWFVYCSFLTCEDHAGRYTDFEKMQKL